MVTIGLTPTIQEGPGAMGKCPVCPAHSFAPGTQLTQCERRRTSRTSAPLACLCLSVPCRCLSVTQSITVDQKSNNLLQAEGCLHSAWRFAKALLPRSPVPSLTEGPLFSHSLVERFNAFRYYSCRVIAMRYLMDKDFIKVKR